MSDKFVLEVPMLEGGHMQIQFDSLEGRTNFLHSIKTDNFVLAQIKTVREEETP